MRIGPIDIFERPLLPLPAQPAGVAWPTDRWPVGPPPSGLEAVVDEMFDPEGELTTTYAVVVVQGGRLVAERYGNELERHDGPATTVTAETPLLSWSMAKSMLHAVVGMLVAEGRLAVDERAAVAAWSGADDPRAAITLEHLLTMRDGLDFLEDYVDGERSDVIAMLFGAGAKDVAAFAADRGLAAPPGERFNYSSGTTNVISGIVRDVLGAGAPYETFVQSRLFDAIGMRSATARFDEAGTWIASSYVFATARDMARFGYLYLRDGVWDGRRLLPEGWVDHARRPRSHDATNAVPGTHYGAQWWLQDDEHGTFRANGYEGQSIMVVPALDLVVVRLGKTEAARYPLLHRWRQRVIEVFAST